MSAMQRTKGRAGEQQVARLLRDHLNINVGRNWQAQSATRRKSDLTGLPGWSVEVKRASEFRRDWWDQAIEQADNEGQTPALVYRLDGQGRGLPEEEKWRVILPLNAICNEDVDLEHTAEITLAAWMQIIRERQRFLTTCKPATAATAPRSRQQSPTQR